MNTIKVKPLRTFGMADGLKTRRSDPFEVPSDIAFQLRESGLVEYVEGKPKKAETQSASADIDSLRAEYEALAGKKPHHLWKEDRLQAEIEKAKAD